MRAEPPTDKRPYRDVFAWVPVRLCHPIYLWQNGRWAWLRRVRRVARGGRRAAFIEVPPEPSVANARAPHAYRETPP